jgi:hypothetical protein
MKRDLGNAINSFLSVTPATVGAGETEVTTNGVSVDRLGYESAVFVFLNNQPTGSPDGVTVTCKIQESSDDTTFTDVSGYSSSHNVTNSATRTEIAVADMTGFERYVRGVMVSNFNGGSGPVVTIAACGILGSPKTYPV